jgi:hypothetical protein
MKKFVIFTLALALGAMTLVGCGCMNTSTNVPTLPTNGETSRPTQATQPSASTETTAATTVPTTGSTEAATESTGTLEGAMDDILGGSTDDTTGTNGAGGNSRGRMAPGGNGAVYGAR